MPKAPSLSRAAFVVTLVACTALFWIAPRPPMGDLPQHAGQIVLLHDLATGTSRWSHLVRINYFTPYLFAYAIATALSFVLPTLVALKVVLTAAYLAFVLSAVALRKELSGDARLDWLFIPGFFGLAFQYGFYPFLVATPLGLMFLVIAKRFADAPTRAAMARMVAAGLLLFFCHGLVFALCVGIGFCMAALRMTRLTAARVVLPYAALGLVLVASFVNARLHEPLLAHGRAPINWEWDKPGGWHRLLAFPDYVVASTLHDYALLPIVALMFIAPWILGDRLNRSRIALVPLGALLAVWFLAPGEVAKTTYLYHRFAVFLLPAYAFAFSPAQAAKSRAALVEGGLALLCWFFLGALAVRERRFAVESAPFERVLSAAEPGERALELIFDPQSAAIRHEWAYHAFALWYQVERQGFVDFNFAGLLPEVVRYRPGQAPPFSGDVYKFDWHALNASVYRYFFVRHTAPLASELFDNDQCVVRLVKEDGDWSLYERLACRY
jgi:hypothetical protein